MPNATKILNISYPLSTLMTMLTILLTRTIPIFNTLVYMPLEDTSNILPKHFLQKLKNTIIFDSFLEFIFNHIKTSLQIVHTPTRIKGIIDIGKGQYAINEYILYSAHIKYIMKTTNQSVSQQTFSQSNLSQPGFNCRNHKMRIPQELARDIKMRVLQNLRNANNNKINNNNPTNSSKYYRNTLQNKRQNLNSINRNEVYVKEFSKILQNFKTLIDLQMYQLNTFSNLRDDFAKRMSNVDQLIRDYHLARINKSSKWKEITLIIITALLILAATCLFYITFTLLYY
jgi:hypothetical protein